MFKTFKTEFSPASFKALKRRLTHIYFPKDTCLTLPTSITGTKSTSHSRLAWTQPKSSSFHSAMAKQPRIWNCDKTALKSSQPATWTQDQSISQYNKEWAGYNMASYSHSKVWCTLASSRSDLIFASVNKKISTIWHAQDLWNWLSLVNSCIYYACQTSEIYQVLP